MKPTDRYWNGVKRPATKAEFFNAVTMPASGGAGNVATIRLYGPIDSWGGYWGISTKDVGQVLDQLPDSVDQIVLRINSPGGEVFEAMAILNMFRAHKARVTAVVDGLAASAASVIAAGCDETVMSPGTQMMIHRVSGITWGNAEDLRKDADVMETLEAGLIEIYTAKAGENDWAQLLSDVTWMSAAEAVAIGLADRTGIVPDAGEAITAGEEPPGLVVILPELADDDAENFAASYTPLHERFAARANQTLVSSEPREPNRRENAVFNSAFKAGVRERLGLTDANASDEELLAALDEQLADEPTDSTSPIVPVGATLIDSQALASLQADAAAGREAREAQNLARREGIVKDALNDGRITPASRAGWLAQLENDEEGTTALINSFAKNTVPVSEIGHSDDVVDGDTALYNRIYPTKED